MNFEQYWASPSRSRSESKEEGKRRRQWWLALADIVVLSMPRPPGGRCAQAARQSFGILRCWQHDEDYDVNSSSPHLPDYVRTIGAEPARTLVSR